MVKEDSVGEIVFIILLVIVATALFDLGNRESKMLDMCADGIERACGD